MVTTALALSSVKSRPSLTLPLQTAMSSAPSTLKKETTYLIRKQEGASNILQNHVGLVEYFFFNNTESILTKHTFIFHIGV